MPISGVVITTRTMDLEQARAFLAGLSAVEVYGADAQGNIVAVFDTRTSEEMEQLMKQVRECPAILHVGVTYINMEDVLNPSPGELH